MSRTLVHVVRHGEVHNPGQVLYGRLPGFNLSETGHAMAVMAAKWLAGRDVVRVVSSPLERARQTAAPIAEVFGLPVHVDDRLIESENKFQGRSVSSVRSFLDARALPLLRNPYRPSWGEPYVAVAERMAAALADARDAVPGQEAVLVSHQLPIVVLRRYVEGRHLWHRPDRRLCGLASVTTFTYDGDRLAAVAYHEPAGALSRKPVAPGA